MKIAFGYNMRVGKDTAVEYLINKLNGKRISFSEPLYDILHYAQNKCNFPIQKDRQFLQYVGTEWARKIDPNVWINILLKNTYNTDENLFISDLRFPNEFEALKQNQWICVKITRPNNNNISEEHTNHISETSLNNILDENWDFVINNDTNLIDFYKKLDVLINNILESK